jgi:hypothetical protein
MLSKIIDADGIQRSGVLMGDTLHVKIIVEKQMEEDTFVCTGCDIPKRCEFTTFDGNKVIPKYCPHGDLCEWKRK